MIRTDYKEPVYYVGPKIRGVVKPWTYYRDGKIPTVLAEMLSVNQLEGLIVPLRKCAEARKALRQVSRLSYLYNKAVKIF